MSSVSQNTIAHRLRNSQRHEAAQAAKALRDEVAPQPQEKGAVDHIVSFFTSACNYIAGAGEEQPLCTIDPRCREGISICSKQKVHSAFSVTTISGGGANPSASAQKLLQDASVPDWVDRAVAEHPFNGSLVGPFIASRDFYNSGSVLRATVITEGVSSAQGIAINASLFAINPFVPAAPTNLPGGGEYGIWDLSLIVGGAVLLSALCFGGGYLLHYERCKKTQKATKDNATPTNKDGAAAVSDQHPLLSPASLDLAQSNPLPAGASNYGSIGQDEHREQGGNRVTPDVSHTDSELGCDGDGC